MKLPKLRFSLRLILVFVTLLAAALAAWPSLEDRAKGDVAEVAYSRNRSVFMAAFGKWNNSQSPRECGMPTTVFPYVVRVVHADPDELDTTKDIYATTFKYYFWAFGPTARLPFKTSIEPGG